MTTAQRRWWQRPGDILWSEKAGGSTYNLVLIGTDSDAWSLELTDSAMPTTSFLWDLDDRSTAGAEKAPSFVREQILDALRERSKHLDPAALPNESMETLHDIVAAVRDGGWLTGRSLRLTKNLSEGDLKKRLRPLVPRYIELDGTAPQDDRYRPSLPALLSVGGDPALHSVLRACFSCFHSCLQTDVSAKEFTLAALLDAGVKREDASFARVVMRIARLHGGEKEDSPHGVAFVLPADVEALSRLDSVAGFLKHLRSDHTSTKLRPWPRAPLRLKAEHELETLPELGEVQGGIIPNGQHKDDVDGDESIITQETRAALAQVGWAFPQPPVKIAEGGGGAVYLCVKKELMESPGVEVMLVDKSWRSDHEAGLAVIKVPHEPDPRFAHEIHAMSQMSHEAFIKILMHGQSAEPTWFLMEYLGGGCLNDHLSTYESDVAKSLRALLPVADALATLHEKQMVHRDCKDKNLLVRSDGRLVLGDVGIVVGEDLERLTDYESPRSRDWMPPWPPEECNTPAQDVYMLCRVAYRMVTGRKNLQPGWLKKDDYNLEAIFRGDERIDLVQHFFEEHIVGERSALVSNNGTELLQAMKGLLSRYATDKGARLVFSSLGNVAPTSISNGTQVYVISFVIGQPFRRLYCKILVLGSAKVFFYGDAAPSGIQIPKSNKVEVTDGWSDEIEAVCHDGPSEGWHRVNVCLVPVDGEVVLTGLSMYVD